MYSCIFCHRSTRRSDGLQYLILHFSERPFSGLVVEAASPPIKFTPTFWCGWNLPIGFINLQGVSSNTLEFQGKIEGSSSILGGSHSIICVQHFRGGSQVVKKSDEHFCACWQVYFVRSSWHSPLLFPGRCTYQRSFLEALFCRLFIVP